MIYIVILIYIFNNKGKWLFFISIITHILGNILSINNIGVNTRDALFYGLFYTMLGYYIYENENFMSNKIIKISKQNLMLILFGTNFIQIIEAYLMGSRTYYFSTIPVCISIFMIIIKYKSILKDSFVNSIGKDSLGIYLIHVMILDTIYLFIHIFNLTNLSNGILWQIMITPIVFMISWRIYRIIKQIGNRVKVKRISNKMIAE